MLLNNCGLWLLFLCLGNLDKYRYQDVGNGGEYYKKESKKEFCMVFFSILIVSVKEFLGFGITYYDIYIKPAEI